MNKNLIKSIIVLIILAVGVTLLVTRKGPPPQTNQPIDEHPEIVINDPVLVSTLVSKEDGSVLGQIYVSYLKDNKNVFSTLLISQQFNDGNAVIYKINNKGYFNPIGKDLEINEEGFYGYEFSLIKDDYFVLHLLNNNGKNISDDINVVWNYDKKVFEVLKTP